MNRFVGIEFLDTFQMPPQIRPLFQNTERLFQEYVRITDEQERWQELANESLVSSTTVMNSRDNEISVNLRCCLTVLDG